MDTVKKEEETIQPLQGEEGENQHYEGGYSAAQDEDIRTRIFLR